MPPVLGSGCDGLVDGVNPIKAKVLRYAITSCLALAAATTVGYLSWHLAPACPVVPPDCHDKANYCASPDWFSNATDCPLLSSQCMTTCGCCNQRPNQWCPNKVNTLQSIIDSSSSEILNYSVWLGIFGILVVIRTKGKARLIATISLMFMLLLGVCYWLAYELTDCQTKPRGVSDVLLVLSVCCSFYAFKSMIMAGALTPSIAEFGGLLANMGDHRSRRDPNLLVLDVSADRTRRFIAEEEQRGVDLTVQVYRSYLARCLQILPILELLVLIAVMVVCGSFGDAEVWQILAASRGMRVSIMFLMIFLLSLTS